jgi:hypothetical protein
VGLCNEISGNYGPSPASAVDQAYVRQAPRSLSDVDDRSGNFVDSEKDSVFSGSPYPGEKCRLGAWWGGAVFVSPFIKQQVKFQEGVHEGRRAL